MQTDKIHRRSNGTIDIDAYRKEASALRTQTYSSVLGAWRPNAFSD